MRGNISMPRTACGRCCNRPEPQPARPAAVFAAKSPWFSSYDRADILTDAGDRSMASRRIPATALFLTLLLVLAGGLALPQAAAAQTRGASFPTVATAAAAASPHPPGSHDADPVDRKRHSLNARH